MDDYNLGFDELISSLDEVSELSLTIEEVIETAQDILIAMCGAERPEEDDRELIASKMYNSAMSRLLSRSEGFSYAVEMVLADAISRATQMFLKHSFESADHFSQSIVASLSTLEHAAEWANSFAAGGMKLIYLHAHDEAEEWLETSFEADLESMPLSYLRPLILAEAFATICGMASNGDYSPSFTSDVMGVTILSKTDRQMILDMIDGDEEDYE